MIFELYGENAIIGRLFRGAEQSMEHRVAIETRQAIPDHPRVSIDQRRDRAISNDAEIEATHLASAVFGAANSPGSAIKPSNQLRNSSTLAAR